MNIKVEISYYPLTENFIPPIKEFIEKLKEEDFTVKVGELSTLIIGDYDKVMNALTKKMGDVIKKHPTSFVIKVVNSCPD